MVGTINDVVNFRKPACRIKRTRDKKNAFTRREPDKTAGFAFRSEGTYYSRWWFAVGVVGGSQV